MIREGYLVPLKGYRINTQQELYNLMGEEEGMERVDIESQMPWWHVPFKVEDRRTIVFCVTVVHAINLARSQSRHSNGCDLWRYAREERLATLKFRQEQYMCLTNVMVLTKDLTILECLASPWRPTRSESLYAQCVGRGLRLAPDKEDCLVLDFVDLSTYHW